MFDLFKALSAHDEVLAACHQGAIVALVTVSSHVGKSVK